ncbi:MAG: TetR/AcrR family transcriptional regulator [Firmicutes bacterium]|nr:TetR/AcrR family transcriptional regulator [Bacillota bacterium]
MKYSDMPFNRIVKSCYDAIIKLVLKYPVNSITIDMILQEAMVSRPTFYKYFEDKYSLMNYVFYHDSIDFSKHFYKSREHFLENSEKIFTVLKDKIAYYQKLALTTGQNSFPEYYQKYYNAYWETFLVLYYGEEYYNAVLKHTFYIRNMGMMEGSLQWMRSGAPELSPKEKATIAYSTYPDFLQKAIEDPDKDFEYVFDLY